MRVRTGRFDGLGLCREPGNAQIVEEFVRQHEMEGHRRVVPPPSAVGSDLPGSVLAHPASAKLPIDDRSPLPVLELQRPEAMAHPLVDAGEDPWRFGDPEVGLPSGQVC